MASASLFGETLLQFSRDGIFPEEEAVSAARVEPSALQVAHQVLDRARDDLEQEVRQISREQPPDIDLWIQHAQGIQDDIQKTKFLASEIVREAESGEYKTEKVNDHEVHVRFLSKEVLFNNQLLKTLKDVRNANSLMNDAQQLSYEKKVVESVNILEEARSVIGAINIDRSIRATTLLHARYEDLHSNLHETFNDIWAALVDINPLEGTVTIHHKSDHTNMDIDQAMLGLTCFDEVKVSAQRFWKQLDDTIVKPRTDLNRVRDGRSLMSLSVEGECLRVTANPADRNIRTLFVDLECIIKYLDRNLPKEFVQYVAYMMMSVLAERIEHDWLRSCIPSSLALIPEYQRVLEQVSKFTAMLDELGWAGSATFHQWVESAPKNWLTKRRDDAMDMVREKLSEGLGPTKEATHTEKGMVTKDESLKMGLGQKSGSVNQEADEWAAWGSDDEVERPHSPLEHRRLSRVTTVPNQALESDDDDAAADAWGEDDGWGFDDEEQTANVAKAARPSSLGSKPKEKEFSLSETYAISSIPDFVLKTIKDVLEDAAFLSSEGNAKLPISPAVTGLFSLPTLILAMYRSVSPLAYSNSTGGNMYLYTDSMYLCDELKNYNAAWSTRDDIPVRIQKRVRLEADVKNLENFGKKAYVEELNSHKTVIKDLMGGAQNFLQTSGQDLDPEVEQNVKIVINHVKAQASAWRSLLPKSAWAQAIGSLVNTIAVKLIQDVADLDALSVDVAESTAKLIEEIITLDELFKPEGADIPLTSQYAEEWLKLQYLSQVLQSNQNDIRFMWFESDLSLYFSAEEIVDLIKLSFAENAGQKLLIREILAKPNPK